MTTITAAMRNCNHSTTGSSRSETLLIHAGVGLLHWTAPRQRACGTDAVRAHRRYVEASCAGEYCRPCGSLAEPFPAPQPSTSHRLRRAELTFVEGRT